MRAVLIDHANTRTYPYCCRSINCGCIDCRPDCENRPELDAFKAWVAEHDAKVLDPVWMQSEYTATINRTE